MLRPLSPQTGHILVPRRTERQGCLDRARTAIEGNLDYIGEVVGGQTVMLDAIVSTVASRPQNCMRELHLCLFADSTLTADWPVLVPRRTERQGCLDRARTAIEGNLITLVKSSAVKPPCTVPSSPHWLRDTNGTRELHLCSLAEFTLTTDWPYPGTSAHGSTRMPRSRQDGNRRQSDYIDKVVGGKTVLHGAIASTLASRHQWHKRAAPMLAC